MLKKMTFFVAGLICFGVCAVDETDVSVAAKAEEAPVVVEKVENKYLVSAESIAGVMSDGNVLFSYFVADVIGLADRVVDVSYSDVSWVKIGCLRSDFAQTQNVFFREIGQALKAKKSTSIAFVTYPNQFESFVVQIMFDENQNSSFAVYGKTQKCPEWIAKVVWTGAALKPSPSVVGLVVENVSGFIKAAAVVAGAILIHRNWASLRHPVAAYEAWMQAKADKQAEVDKAERVKSKRAFVAARRKKQADAAAAFEKEKKEKLVTDFEVQMVTDAVSFASDGHGDAIDRAIAPAVTLTDVQKEKLGEILSRRAAEEVNVKRWGTIFKGANSLAQQRLTEKGQFYFDLLFSEELMRLRECFLQISPKTAELEAGVVYAVPQQAAHHVLTQAFPVAGAEVNKENLEEFVAQLEFNESKHNLLSVDFRAKVLELKKLYTDKIAELASGEE
jgi:hypothetical protein